MYRCVVAEEIASIMVHSATSLQLLPILTNERIEERQEAIGPYLMTAKELHEALDKDVHDTDSCWRDNES